MLIRARMTLQVLQVRGATGLLQQGLDTAHAEEFDAKNHAEISKDDGKRRPRAAGQHL